MDTLQFNLHRGLVLDINDPDQKGKVQVKVLPEMVDIEDSNCPWFPPFEGNGSTNEYDNHPPEVGSYVWLLADDKFYHRYYTHFKYNLEGLVDYSPVDTLLSTISGLDTTYENIQFTMYQDGGISFHNRNDGSHGYIQNSSTYMIMNSEGVIDVMGSSIELNGNTKTFVTHTELDTALQTFITALNLHTHPDPTSGTTGIPSTSMSLDISSSQTTTIKTGG